MKNDVFFVVNNDGEYAAWSERRGEWVWAWGTLGATEFGGELGLVEAKIVAEHLGGYVLEFNEAYDTLPNLPTADVYSGDEEVTLVQKRSS